MEPLQYPGRFSIDKVLANLVRYENGPVSRHALVPPPFGSFTANFNFLSSVYGGAEDVAIELAHGRGIPFCSATVLEHARARDELGKEAASLPYWEPSSSVANATWLALAARAW